MSFYFPKIKLDLYQKIIETNKSRGTRNKWKLVVEGKEKQSKKMRVEKDDLPGRVRRYFSIGINGLQDATR